MAMIKEWMKRLVGDPLTTTDLEQVGIPVNLIAVHPDGGDPRKLSLDSAKDFLNQLTLDSLSNIQFESLHQPPMTIQKAFKAGVLNWSNKGLVIVMRKDSNRFDIAFSDLWTRLKAIGAGESKKLLVENQIMWNWKWELENVVCYLSYWNFLNKDGDEGLKFHCKLKSA